MCIKFYVSKNKFCMTRVKEICRLCANCSIYTIKSPRIPISTANYFQRFSSIHLKRCDFVIVDVCHLVICEGFPCLLIDLKTSVETQVIKQLKQVTSKVEQSPFRSWVNRNCYSLQQDVEQTSELPRETPYLVLSPQTSVTWGVYCEYMYLGGNQLCYNRTQLYYIRKQWCSFSIN